MVPAHSDCLHLDDQLRKRSHLMAAGSDELIYCRACGRYWLECGFGSRKSESAEVFPDANEEFENPFGYSPERK